MAVFIHLTLRGGRMLDYLMADLFLSLTSAGDAELFGGRRRPPEALPSLSDLRRDLLLRRQSYLSALNKRGPRAWWQRRRHAALTKKLEWQLMRTLRRFGIRSIAGFHPCPGEPNLIPLLIRLHRQGWQVALPESTETQAHRAVNFRRWNPDDGPIRSSQRMPQAHTAPLSFPPDIILVPMLGFDAHGMRVGTGRGHYDRTLAALRAEGRNPLMIGVAFDFQEVPMVPPQTHDVPLPLVVTPSRHIQPLLTPVRV